jgi:nucleotide-binding universal stress UspA family protein
MFQPHLILHPTDFSERSAYAFHIALDLARQHQAKILILHVVETLGPENVSYGEATATLQPEGYQQRLWDDIRRVQPPPGSAIVVEHLLAEGDPASQIPRVAHDYHCDLIVMGSHGHTGLRHLFLGSVAEKVVRLSHCPVLISKQVWPPGSAESGPGSQPSEP